MGQPVRLGRFRAIELLKCGRVSSLYQGEDPTTGQQVRVTLYRPTDAAPAQVPGHERLEREFRQLARERHPGVVSLVDVGRANGASYTATLLCTDPTLEHLLGRGALPNSEALRILRSTARTLDDLHQRGIVHRNLAASSVFVSTEGAVRLSEFLSLERASAALLDPEPRLEEISSAAPEQVLGYRLRPAANRYSFAVLAYRMLSGSAPFATENPIGFLYDTVYTQAPVASSRNSDLPAAMDEVLAAALSKDPEQRPSQCSELVRQLDGALSSGRAGKAKTQTEPPAATGSPARWPVLAPSLFSSRELALANCAAPVTKRAPNDNALAPQPEQLPVPSNTGSRSASRPAGAASTPEPWVGKPAVSAVVTRPAGPGSVVLPDPEQIDEHRRNQSDDRRSVFAGMLAKLRQFGTRPKAGHASGSIVSEEYLADWRAGMGRDRAVDPLHEGTAMEPCWRVKIESGKPGASIWVNGRFHGRVPADIEINGHAGESVALEMRWRGGGVVRTDLKLHPLMPKVWKPEV